MFVTHLEYLHDTRNIYLVVFSESMQLETFQTISYIDNMCFVHNIYCILCRMRWMNHMISLKLIFSLSLYILTGTSSLGIAAAPLTIAILSRERGLIYLFFAVDGVRKLCKCRINDGKRIRHKDFVVLNSKVYLKSTQSLLYDPASVSFRAFPFQHAYFL